MARARRAPGAAHTGGMELVPVFVADWEMRCCGDPFALGTEVRWDLDFLYEDEFAAPAQALLPAGTALTAAMAPGPDEPAGGAGARGLLLATWHRGEGPRAEPASTGTVRRIRLVRQPAVREGTRTTVVPGGARLTELTRSRTHFAGASWNADGGAWAETGLLVDLATDLDAVLAALAR